jgi:bifunctional UDP-N-acetylglucosamine pyrophosphorylase / glucosamine-1-phosphate N-acetyltransferase
MTNPNLSVAILAAGLGTRMRSKRAKVLHRAGGKALVEHVVQAALNLAPAESIAVVTGYQAEEVEALLAPAGIKFVRQPGQKGTGHALECCRETLGRSGGKSGDRLGASAQGSLLMVLYGDTPLLSASTLAGLFQEQAASSAAATMITTSLSDPTGYGRVILDSNRNVTAIVEHKNCTPEQRSIRVINSGIYCFRADLLWKYLGEVQPNPTTGEYYLTDMAEILTRHGHRVAALHCADPDELLGINTRVELADADRVLRERKCRDLMLAGVTVERPETVTVDIDVTVGADSVIEPFTRLLGRTVIGEECRIGAGAIIENSNLANGVTVAPYTLIADSTIDAGAQVGPFARLRMNAQVGADARIGNFVELKKTRLGAGAKSQHLAYLGDAEIGAGSNIGAGTITCNYDGELKHGTKIGAGAFIGSNSTLVAPIEIGDDAYIGAGSVITDPVPAEALALGRGRQVNKEGWAARRKQRRAPAAVKT